MSFHHSSPYHHLQLSLSLSLSVFLLLRTQPMEMSNSNQRDIPVAYPVATTTQQTCVMAPPPTGYPMKDGYNQAGDSRHGVPAETSSRGEGFWKGCVAAICCCWILDFCFGC